MLRTILGVVLFIILARQLFNLYLAQSRVSSYSISLYVTRPQRLTSISTLTMLAFSVFSYYKYILSILGRLILLLTILVYPISIAVVRLYIRTYCLPFNIRLGYNRYQIRLVRFFLYTRRYFFILLYQEKFSRKQNASQACNVHSMHIAGMQRSNLLNPKSPNQRVIVCTCQARHIYAMFA